MYCNEFTRSLFLYNSKEKEGKRQYEYKLTDNNSSKRQNKKNNNYYHKGSFKISSSKINVVIWMELLYLNEIGFKIKI